MTTAAPYAAADRSGETGLVPTVADVLRGRAAARGIPLDHIDDRELGSRLVSMPVALTDDLDRVAAWLVYGTEHR